MDGWILLFFFSVCVLVPPSASVLQHLTSGVRREWRARSPLLWLIGCPPAFNELPASRASLHIQPERPVEAGAHFSFVFIYTLRGRAVSSQGLFCFCRCDLQVFGGICEPSLADLQRVFIRTVSLCVWGAGVATRLKAPPWVDACWNTGLRWRLGMCLSSDLLVRESSLCNVANFTLVSACGLHRDYSRWVLLSPSSTDVSCSSVGGSIQTTS